MFITPQQLIIFKFIPPVDFVKGFVQVAGKLLKAIPATSDYTDYLRLQRFLFVDKIIAVI